MMASRTGPRGPISSTRLARAKAPNSAFAPGRRASCFAIVPSASASATIQHSKMAASPGLAAAQPLAASDNAAATAKGGASVARVLRDSTVSKADMPVQ